MKRLLLTFILSATAPLLYATPSFSGGHAGPTPYDQYLGPVVTVLRQLDGSTPSFYQVAALVKKGFGFEYSYDTPYVPNLPRVTAARQAGDCKDKSLWLASEMNDPSVRFVIGKVRRSSRISHAWLMWKNGGRWWILDPTNLSAPIQANAVASDEYLISYSYDRTGSYAYNTSTTSSSRRRVAGRN
jgi:hypothetical protein